MKKNLISASVGFLIAVVLAGAIFLWLKPRPAPAALHDPVVMINPSPEVRKQAESVQTIKHVFTIKQPDIIQPQEKQVIPVAVTVRDEKTGQTQEAKTVAEVQKTEDGDLNVKLSDEIAVDIPESKHKTWAVGVYYSNEDWGGFVEKDFKLKTLGEKDLYAYTRVEKDHEERYQAGLLLRF